MAPEILDSLDKDGLNPLVGRLLAKIDELLAQIKSLNARIAELEGRGSQPPKTPDNSSLPPSRGQKANVAEPKPEKKRRVMSKTCLRHEAVLAWRANSARTLMKRAMSTLSVAAAARRWPERIRFSRTPPARRRERKG